MSAGVLTVDTGVATLRIASDEAPHVDEADLARLEDEASALAADPAVRVVVLVGGERTFCMGAAQQTLTAEDAPARIARLMRGFPKLVLDLPVPVIAAMSGHAVGGGFAVGLWCDVAFLAEESLYGANFVALGMTPGMGTTALMAEAFGAPLARELLFSGRLVKGRDLLEERVPLSRYVAPRAQVLSRAQALAREIAVSPRSVLSALKRMLARRRTERNAPILDEEQAAHAALFADPETRRRIAENYE